MLVRNPSLTHLINADQKVIELPVVRRDGGTITVATPPSANVAPAGPYWLFVNKRTAKGATPSVGRQVFVGTQVPDRLRPVIERNNAEMLRRELPPLHVDPPAGPGKRRGPKKPKPHVAPAGAGKDAPAAPAAPAAEPAVLATRGVSRRSPAPAAPYVLAGVVVLGVLATRRRLVPPR
ncbi:MAG TPA: galactose oxidase-like domain-containing protein [Frankiaceae bacterium]|nr:galactose oxidase-like domain-containing protein [Frankiaceae bacterium]